MNFRLVDLLLAKRHEREEKLYSKSQEVLPIRETKVSEDPKPSLFSDEETLYCIHSPEKWWPVDDLLDSPDKLPRTDYKHEPSSHLQYQSLLRNKTSETYTKASSSLRNKNTLSSQINDNPFREMQSRLTSKPEHREQIQRHGIHPSSAGKANQAETLSLHSNTAISKDHDYCFQPLRKGDFVSDSFIANCLLNPNLEEEVLKETEAMRMISKQGLISN